MDCNQSVNSVLHWNYRGFTEFPLNRLRGEEAEITDIYLKENLISRIPGDIGALNNLESLYLSGNDITELPKEISKLCRLKCLDLSGNRLQYIPDEIGQMRSLKFLILDENELCELPLRVAELRALRYLSVCDNKLQWLPQRPVYNYHHCEFRFWRNPHLKTIPYSLWYHMFRGQQTRSLSIGCLSIPKCDNDSKKGRCVLRLSQNREYNIEINVPRRYQNILNKSFSTVPTLMEICKRKFYQMLSEASRKFCILPISIYCDRYNAQFDCNNNIDDLQQYFNGLNLSNNLRVQDDINEDEANDKHEDNNLFCYKIRRKGYCTPADIVDAYFYYMPKFIKIDLCNGPISRCENVDCKKPIFDFVHYEFCLEKISLIENSEDVILSAEFCSKRCAEMWKTGKTLLFCKFI